MIKLAALLLLLSVTPSLAAGGTPDGGCPAEPVPAKAQAAAQPTATAVHSVKDGVHVITVNRRAPLTEDICARPVTYERLERCTWVPVQTWYRIFKNCDRFVDEGAPTAQEQADYCRCESHGNQRPAQTEFRWSGKTITGPAPAGHYRAVLPDTTVEFDLK